MLRSDSYNKYDYYIIILLASLAVGAIGGAYTPVRILSVLFVPFVFPLLKLKSNRYLRIAISVLVFFYFYSVVSLLWTPDISEGIKVVVYDVIFIVLFTEIITFAYYSKNPLMSICLGWTIAIIIVGTIGMWEIFTDNHLSISTMGSNEFKRSEGEIFMFRYASATFGNFNTFVTVICFSLPFLLYLIMLGGKTHILIKSMTVVAIMEAIIVLFYNASRGGLFTLAILFFFLMIYILKNKDKQSKRFSFLFILLIIAAFIFYGENLLATISFRAAHSNLGEDSSRFQLIQSSLEILFNTAGLGTGAGGLYETMKMHNRGGIEAVATHNMYIELLAQYGVIIFTLFAMYIYSIFKTGFNSNNRLIRMICQMAFFAMPTTLVINSLYLLRSETWCYLASIYVFVFLYKYKPSVQ